MLSQVEQQLINAPEMAGFPLVAAVRSLVRNCGKCGHNRTNPNSALRLAVSRYRTNPSFVAACGKVIKLPAMVGGVLVQ